MLKKALIPAAFLLLPLAAFAAPEVSITPADITFSNAKPLSGQTVRIYATVRNSGDRPAQAVARFFIDNIPLGADQPLSAVVGKGTTVFVDWQPSEGYYKVSVELVKIDPPDTSAGDNRAEFKDFIVDLDSDGDGKYDTDDWDDDNDGVDDGVERINGTDPNKYDTDGDGVNDKDDAWPRDPSRSKLEVKKEEPAPLSPPARGGEQGGVGEAEKQPSDKTSSPKPSPPSSDGAGLPLPRREGTISQEREFTKEEVNYTFPDQQEAEYKLEIALAKSRQSWNEWQFDVLGSSDSLLYLWDFGDGKLSEAVSPAHSFSGWGKYKVTLSASDSKGGLGTAETEIIVGFWNLANPWLQVILAVLGLLLVGLVIVAIGGFSPAIKKFYEI